MQHLNAFLELGNFFSQFVNGKISKTNTWFSALENALIQAEIKNKWYTQDNLRHVLTQWSKLLQEDAITIWQSQYNFQHSTKAKTIAIIMAGNIPLVGFHDFLCVLLSGNKVLAKLSSNDKVLLPFIAKFLISYDDELKLKIAFTDEKLKKFDAVIATGSTNTSRYFEYYFGKYPSIIRKNRNSVAVLSGKEDTITLEALSEDIFRYFGLGCRSVSKIFVPKGYDFEPFFNSIFKWKSVLDHNKYVNNYDYNKAVYLMSEIQILDNGFLVLKEDTSYASPIATLFYEYYEDNNSLAQRLTNDATDIQCVVAKGVLNTEIDFGTTQVPLLTDYADGVDTMMFLQDLK